MPSCVMRHCRNYTSKTSESLGITYHAVRRSSFVWQYFKIKDERNSVATCNACHNDYSYRSSITNLSKHWKSKHGKIIEDDITDASDESSNHSDKDVNTDNMPQKIIPNNKSTWHYFDVIDNDKFTARCKMCGKDVSYDCIEELAEHAKEEHDISVSDDGEIKSDNERTILNLTRAKRLTSHVWRYMQVVDDRNAVCRLCNKKLSYLTSTSNLKKHLKRAHPNVKLDVSEKIDQKVFIASDGHVYEVQNSDVEKDPISTNEEYLENFDDNNSIDHFETVTTTSSAKENKTLKTPEKPSLKRHISKEVFHSHSKSNSSNEDVPPVKKSKHMKTLEIFGEYIISLLSQMPQQVCDQLQSEIIKQIFMAKVALNNQNIVTVDDKPVTVTINKGTGGSMPEITVNHEGIVMTQEDV